MLLIQILLPLSDNQGKSLDSQHRRVKRDLSERFQGLTAYSRAPAKGLWKKGGRNHHDEIVIYEIMVKVLDKKWWRDYRSGLESRFRQESVVIRSQRISLL